MRADEVAGDDGLTADSLAVCGGVSCKDKNVGIFLGSCKYINKSNIRGRAHLVGLRVVHDDVLLVVNVAPRALVAEVTVGDGGGQLQVVVADVVVGVQVHKVVALRHRRVPHRAVVRVVQHVVHRLRVDALELGEELDDVHTRLRLVLRRAVPHEDAVLLDLQVPSRALVGEGAELEEVGLLHDAVVASAVLDDDVAVLRLVLGLLARLPPACGVRHGLLLLLLTEDVLEHRGNAPRVMPGRKGV